MTRLGNRFGVWMYRALDGRLSSGASVRVLIVTTPGRRTGAPRSTCVRYVEGPAGFIVWGTGSGSRNDPDWFENLRAVSVADVQVRARSFQAAVRELVGVDRDATWANVVLVQAPGVSKYAKKAGRTISVAVLTPPGRHLSSANSLPAMSRRAWLMLLVVLVGVGGYLAYDWSRPCVGGPVHGFVKAAVNGGHYTVRCAG